MDSKIIDKVLLKKASVEEARQGTLKSFVTTNSAAITGLSSSTTDPFTVKAKDAAGNVSAASSAVSVSTPIEIVCGSAVPWTNTSFANQTGINGKMFYNRSIENASKLNLMTNGVLNKGFYIVKVSDSQSTYNQKFIIK